MKGERWGMTCNKGPRLDVNWGRFMVHLQFVVDALTHRPPGSPPDPLFSTSTTSWLHLDTLSQIDMCQRIKICHSYVLLRAPEKQQFYHIFPQISTSQLPYHGYFLYLYDAFNVCYIIWKWNEGILHDVLDVCCTLLATKKILFVRIHLPFLKKPPFSPWGKNSRKK